MILNTIYFRSIFLIDLRRFVWVNISIIRMLKFQSLSFSEKNVTNTAVSMLAVELIIFFSARGWRFKSSRNEFSEYKKVEWLYINFLRRNWSTLNYLHCNQHFQQSYRPLMDEFRSFVTFIFVPNWYINHVWLSTLMIKYNWSIIHRQLFINSIIRSPRKFFHILKLTIEKFTLKSSLFVQYLDFTLTSTYTCNRIVAWAV